jgi:hypothetical protein
MIDGKPTLPFWIEIDEQTRAALNLDALEHSVPFNLSRALPMSHAFGQAV